MRGVKFLSIFAACGFLLSFVSGLFSHSSILSILLKALIFGIIFGALGFLISLIYTKFLDDGLSGDSTGDYSLETPVAKSSGNQNGQLVDMVVGDEDLSEGESNNHYVVGNNHQMLNDSDLGGRKSVSQDSSSNERLSNENVKPEAQESSGFIPLKNFETVNNVSGNEAVSPQSVTSPGVIDSTNSELLNDRGIDTLPDMNSLVIEDNDNSESEDDVSTDSEFVSSANMHKGNDEQPEIKDAALLAKAISSVLSDENSL